MSRAEKTDPDLWEEVKDQITRSDKGGEPGQWSARKAQMAVQEYKKRGGGYADDGPDQGETDLNRWTEEEWGTKSGAQSGESGERYLPKQVRQVLTDDEYARSTEKKQDGAAQFVDQPDDVREKAAKIRRDGPTREMLLDRARDLHIEGRSDMTKDELLRAIDKVTDENGRKTGSGAALCEKSREELYEMAKDREVEGRSDMTKDELVKALQR